MACSANDKDGAWAVELPLWPNGCRILGPIEICTAYFYIFREFRVFPVRDYDRVFF